MKIGETNALGVQAIKVWRLDHLVPMAGEVAIALIVRENKHHVRTFRCYRVGMFCCYAVRGNQDECENDGDPTEDIHE